MDTYAPAPDSMPSMPTTETLSHPKLQVDFSWKRFKGLITNPNDPTAKPLYVVHWNAIKTPHLIFKRAENGENGEIVGTGTLHAIRIKADYEVAGRKGTLMPLSKFKTRYSHESYAFSTNPDKPVTLTWTSDSGFTSWDFVCSDEHGRPIAKYTAKIWGIKKIGYIEFMDDRPLSVEARDEMVVTGMTLFYCMWLRVNNIFNLFGAVFHSVPDKEKEKEKERKALEESQPDTKLGNQTDVKATVYQG